MGSEMCIRDRYVYDIVITDAGNVKTRVIEGSVLLREGVTR